MTRQHICMNTNHIFPYIYKWFLFFSEQLHFCVGEFVDERLDCGPKYKAICVIG